MRVNLKKAAEILLRGDVVAIPTETVYGLAACLNQPKAIEKIFKIKGRPSNNPLIIHVSHVDGISGLTQSLPNEVYRLAEAFWPGALTLVLPANEKVPLMARAGLPTAAFRIPNHEITHELLKMVGPIVAPSANLSGRPSATKPEHVEEDFGEDLAVLEGGSCQKGVESTILGMSEGQWKVYRQGSIPSEAFAEVLGYIPDVLKLEKDKAPLCPGQLYRHYAPKAKLRVSGEPLDGEVVVGFADRNYSGKKIFILGHSDKPEEVAQNLYAILRQLDQEHIKAAWVDMNFPRYGLWQTIAERLKKAANE